MFKQKGFTAFQLIVALFFFAAVGGWVANIVKLCGSDLAHLTALPIVRAIGIFVAPLGAVLGFI